MEQVHGSCHHGCVTERKCDTTLRYEVPVVVLPVWRQCWLVVRAVRAGQAAQLLPTVVTVLLPPVLLLAGTGSTSTSTGFLLYFSVVQVYRSTGIYSILPVVLVVTVTV
jgi:hypothetical protein